MRSSAKVAFQTMVPKFLLLLALLSVAATSSKAAPQSGENASNPSQQTQKQFATPKQASETLIQATKTFDLASMREILGPDGEDLVSSQDPVRDKNIAAAFAAKASEKNQITVDPKNPSRAILSVGEDDWPLPIPLVKKNGKWSFDTVAGRQEILLRRIGANELDAIQICRGYVEAQNEYATEKHDDAEVNQYAQRIISSHDRVGLYPCNLAPEPWRHPLQRGLPKLHQGFARQDHRVYQAC